MRTAYGYIRVRSQDQADSGLGLEAPRQRIRAYCGLNRLHLAEIFEDPGISGGKALSSRPAGRQNWPIRSLALESGLHINSNTFVGDLRRWRHVALGGPVDRNNHFPKG